MPGLDAIAQKAADDLTCAISYCQSGNDDSERGFFNLHFTADLYQHDGKIDAHTVAGKVYDRQQVGDLFGVWGNLGSHVTSVFLQF